MLTRETKIGAYGPCGKTLNPTGVTPPSVIVVGGSTVAPSSRNLATMRSSTIDVFARAAVYALPSVMA